jgi:RNA polymerase sigma-70 factor (ECF subfamily)
MTKKRPSPLDCPSDSNGNSDPFLKDRSLLSDPKEARHEMEMSTPREHQDEFEASFSRCRKTLHFIACGILAGNNRAESAVRNCWRRASRHRPSFDGEGEFRSWLLRILINEAMAILHNSQKQPSQQ